MPPTRPEATWRLRSLTPAGAEVTGAGHNSLGAWWWLAMAGAVPLEADGGAVVAQEIGGRVLPVRVSGRDGRPKAIVIEQAPPELGRTVTDRDELAGALGLEPGGRALADDVPVQVVSTGAAHLLVPARDRTVVDAARPDPSRLAAALERVGGQGCYLYCLDPVARDAVAYARFFNPTVGIHEDPASGSAAGPLVSLLVAGRGPRGRVRGRGAGLCHGASEPDPGARERRARPDRGRRRRRGGGHADRLSESRTRTAENHMTEADERNLRRAVDTGAIARTGLGRVVFALSGEQLQDLRPRGAVGPDAVQVAYEGPALFDEARVPINGYYT